MRNVRRALIAVLVTVVTGAAQPPAGWSSIMSLSSGTRVRIATAESKTVTGELESVTDSSLTVNPGRGPQSIDRRLVMRVSVRTKARRKRSIAIGLAVGAGGGAAIGGAAASSCSGNICGGHGAAFIAGGAAGAAIVGGLIGAAVSHGGWREIYRQ
jgi:hypothetical protein